MRLKRICCTAWLALGAISAHADVEQAAADSFFITFSTPLKAPPAKAWAALIAVPAWWSDDNTFSGKAANLSLKAEAGGCFCERWADGSAEHGRVVMVNKDHLLRLDIALGPLQEFALKGSLNFWIRADPDSDQTATLAVEYRVNGSSTSGLDVLAPQVDTLLGNEVERLQRFIDTGVAAAPAVVGNAAAATPSASAPRVATPRVETTVGSAAAAEKKSAAQEDILRQWAAEARAAAAADSAPAKAVPKSRSKPAKPKQDTQSADSQP